MKKIRLRCLSAVLALMMCVSLVPTALAAETPSSWAAADVKQAIEARLVPQSLQSRYTQPITRAEFAALAVTVYEVVKGTEITGRTQFNDTSDVNVQKAAAIGVVSGVGNNNFSPAAGLTREQAAAMLSRLADTLGKPLTKQTATFADTSTVSSWAVEAVGQMQTSGIMGGVGGNAFAPQGDYTREQSIMTALRLYELVKPEEPKPEPSDYQEVSYTSLVSRADQYKGTRVRLTGKVRTSKPSAGQVELQVYVKDGGTSDYFLATYNTKDILEDYKDGDWIDVYGIADGVYDAFGDLKPKIKVETITGQQISTGLKLNHDFGPCTLYQYYSSGDLWSQLDISSFVVTKLESTNLTGKYKIYYKLAGTSTDSSASFDLCFYDGNGTELGQVLVQENVTPNQPFTASADHFVEAELIEGSTRVGLLSRSGDLPDQPRTGSGSGQSSDKNSGGSSDKDGGGVEINRSATYDSYSNVPDFGKVFGVAAYDVDEDEDGSTFFTYLVKDTPGAVSDVKSIYASLLNDHGFFYSNSQGSVSSGVTYDVYIKGSVPNVEMMVSIGIIYNGSKPYAYGINVRLVG